MATPHLAFVQRNPNPTRNTNTSTAPGSSSELSSGPVAAISIATFIFGIALALLCFWFCMNRRKHSAGGRSQRSFGANGLRGDKAEGIPTTSMAEQSLLDPIDDSTLKGTMAKLDNFIDQHVLGHYHEDQIQISTTQLAQAITDCNIKTSASSMPADEFARLLINPATRFHAIRRFIAWVILSNTNLDAQAAACLLPSFIVAFYNSFPPVERQAGCEEGTLLLSHSTHCAPILTDPLAFETALTNWKHISAFLLVENRTFREDPKLHESQIRAAIDQNVKWIHYVLAPFLTNSSKHSGEWEKNLRAIILAGAELGFTLFSQQSNWVFDWKAHSKSEAPVTVVFPALLEKAKGRTRLRIVSEAVLA
ncbi:uncharacterized protein PAC_00118 [Phialocephala subalpina]|uniref:Uncharacterized protein n=1 Tax=Phialocephala subalpina TaxID=576137 RepID=A0A1L7WBU4_9HELO|nr:uncharacterized protein PAC_00118 [Phialocephala subalpina]